MVEIPTHLTDSALMDAVPRLAADERTATATLVAHLAEVDRRRLAVAAGHSLFTYCREVLRLSEDAACNRTTAVRMVRAFPSVLPMLADGRLNLSTLRVLAPHLTAANHAGLFEEAAGKSRRLVEELVARHFPQPVTTSIRKLARPASPASTGTGVPLATDSAASAGAGATAESPGSAAAGGAAPAIPVPSSSAAPAVTLAARPVTPMAEDVFLIRLAARRAMVDRLRRAQDLLAHAVPRGDVTEVFDRALIALLADLEKKAFAATDRPRAPKPNPAAPGTRTRTIPAAVRRAVRARDGDRCAYVSPDGRRCAARAYLQLHHLRPYEVGGGATAENIAVRCRAHNQYEADVYFAPIRNALGERHSIRPGADGQPGREAVPG